MKTYTYYDGDTFERGGHTFKVDHPYDDSSDAPWERCDGHGPVSDWTRRDKRPGERILCTEGTSRRYYDWQAACKLARADGWNAEPYDAPNRIERAVTADFKFLQDWCEDRWQYVGVVVTLLDADGGKTRAQESLWGIESIAYDYLAETAHELADQILAELEEREHWAARDVLTTA